MEGPFNVMFSGSSSVSSYVPEEHLGFRESNNSKTEFDFNKEVNRQASICSLSTSMSYNKITSLNQINSIPSFEAKLRERSVSSNLHLNEITVSDASDLTQSITSGEFKMASDDDTKDFQPELLPYDAVSYFSPADLEFSVYSMTIPITSLYVTYKSSYAASGASESSDGNIISDGAKLNSSESLYDDVINIPMVEDLFIGRTSASKFSESSSPFIPNVVKLDSFNFTGQQFSFTLVPVCLITNNTLGHLHSVKLNLDGYSYSQQQKGYVKTRGSNAWLFTISVTAPNGLLTQVGGYHWFRRGNNFYSRR